MKELQPSLWSGYCLEVMEDEYFSLCQKLTMENLKKDTPLWNDFIRYYKEDLASFNMDGQMEVYKQFKYFLSDGVTDDELQKDIDQGRACFQLDSSFPIRDFYIAVFNELFPSGYFK